MKDKANSGIEILKAVCRDCRCRQTLVYSTSTQYFKCVKCKSPNYTQVEEIKRDDEQRVIPNNKGE